MPLGFVSNTPCRWRYSSPKPCYSEREKRCSAIFLLLHDDLHEALSNFVGHLGNVYVLAGRNPCLQVARYEFTNASAKWLTHRILNKKGSQPPTTSKYHGKQSPGSIRLLACLMFTLGSMARRCVHLALLTIWMQVPSRFKANAVFSTASCAHSAQHSQGGKKNHPPPSSPTAVKRFREMRSAVRTQTKAALCS